MLLCGGGEVFLSFFPSFVLRKGKTDKWALTKQLVTKRAICAAAGTAAALEEEEDYDRI